MRKKIPVSDVVSHLLSRPPVCEGWRLRPEQEIASLFGVSRQYARRSMDRLVEDGFLTRRKGSGTYVRKVVPCDLLPECSEIKQYSHISVEDIFADDSAAIVRLVPEQTRQALKIGLFSVITDATDISQTSILAGIQNEIKALNHQLQPLKCHHKSGALLPKERIVELLKEAGLCDGYLVENSWYDFFKSIYSMAFHVAPPPVAYFCSGSVDICHEPIIQIDTYEAIGRAFRIFHEQDLRHVALLDIALNIFSHNRQSKATLYEALCKRYGFSGDFAIGIHSLQDDSPEVIEELNKVWQSSKRPQAMYVANDRLLSGVTKWLKENDIIPGHDIGIITLSNKGRRLPKEYTWSQLEFDPGMIGKLAVDSLTQVIRTTGVELASFSHQARWIPGETHLLKKELTES